MTVFTSWLPSLYPEEVSAVNKKVYYETVVGDSLTLSTNLAAGFARATFSCEEARSSQTIYDGCSEARCALYRYKHATIQIIRRRLAENPDTLDQNIFLGIITLAGCDFMANNAQESRLHVQACLDIARARGGLRTLSDLELEIMCLDEFLLSSLSGEAPCTPLGEMSDAMQARFPQNTVCSDLSVSGITGIPCTCPEESKTREGLALLFDATKQVNRLTASKSKKAKHDHLVLQALYAGFQLCASSASGTEAGLSAYDTSLRDLCTPLRLAGILVVATTHLKNTPRRHLLDRVTEELEESLQIADSLQSSREDDAITAAMLWIYFVGAYAASASRGGRQLFFLRGIAQLQASGCSLSNSQSNPWSEIREVLKRFPYIDKEFDTPFEEIWKVAGFWSGSVLR